MKRAIAASAAALFLCVAFAGAAARAPQSDEDPLDLKSIPIADWLDEGEHAQIPWDFHVGEPYLRVDQRLEVSYVVSFRGKELNKIGNAHELFFVSRVSSPDGE